MVSHPLDALAGGAGVSTKDRVFALWWVYKPKTFRQARQHVLLLDEPADVTEGTLRVYFSQWKRSHGIQRRYRKSKDE